MARIIALIPARAGSKRVPGKNVRLLADHPLLAYAVVAARESGIFDRVVVSSDSEEYLEIARRYGAETVLRSPYLAADASPDIEWVEHALSSFPGYDAFSILRPTAPFRQVETIRRAWAEFQEDTSFDSLRAVELVRQHPGKMWLIEDSFARPARFMRPFWHGTFVGPVTQPYHSMPTQALPLVYVQNASLEMAWTRVVYKTRTIAGLRIRPFFTGGYEGFDLNTEDDWILAEALIARGLASLPILSESLLEAQLANRRP